MILAGLISRVARLAAESGAAVGGTGPPSDTRESDPFLRHITMTLLVPTVLCTLNGVVSYIGLLSRSLRRVLGRMSSSHVARSLASRPSGRDSFSTDVDFETVLLSTPSTTFPDGMAGFGLSGLVSRSIAVLGGFFRLADLTDFGSVVPVKLH